MAKMRSLILLPLTSLVLLGIVGNDRLTVGQHATASSRQEEPGQEHSLHPQETSKPTTTLSLLRPLPGVRSFTGRVVKVGNRYALQDAVVGAIYDIDPQPAARDFEGMMVRLNGTLDPSGKIIHLEPPQRYW